MNQLQLKFPESRVISGNTSYRQMFGLKNPPLGTTLRLKYMAGLKWYLHWEECPDGEDIIQGWFGTADKAKKYAKNNGWLLTQSTA